MAHTDTHAEAAAIGHSSSPTEWYKLDVRAVLAALSSGREGLTNEEAGQRLSKYGPNELSGSSTESVWKLLARQLTEVMVVILIAAALISALLRDYKDAVVILLIVVLNAALGFSQEYRAEKAMSALKRLSSPSVKVRRGGDVREVPASGLVPGDVVLLEAGNLVAADCRVLESVNLQTQEASLTGESVPVAKTTEALSGSDVPLGDRLNTAYMGTFVTAGRGLGIVTETGMTTELGRIAGMIHGVEREPTPLQLRLAQLGKGLAAAALFLVALIFVLGLVRGENLKLMFLTAVSIGVAAVPEGLPAVVTIALTLGAQRMLRRRALIRKLSAVETLGSVTVICSDKTGTLTENRMAVAVLQLVNSRYEFPAGVASVRREAEPSLADPGFGLLLAAGSLCNDAIYQSQAESAMPLGDPTETALLVAALRLDVDKNSLEQTMPRVAEVAFTSERKRMTTIHQLPSDLSSLPSDIRAVLQGSHPSYVVFSKGSAESILETCTSLWADGQIKPLDEVWRERLDSANNALASSGMRILGTAFRLLDSIPAHGQEMAVESGLTFVGLAGLMDPPRPEAALAVKTCKEAGIRPIMITGDHPLTAQHIARDLGIDGDESVLTGAQLDRLPVDQFSTLVDSTPVYARVAPEHKLKIVDTLQRRHQIVAMTGDGVNDAPALKKADIGVAMGITGTDVAKEAADMVLLDDNFATIVAAVEEGRRIYDNIRKFIKYILATNSGEIWVMLLAPFLGMSLPLLPLQILWMNLVTDGLPALALSIEPSETDVMGRPPRPPKESIFARGMGLHVIWVGLLMGVLALGLGFGYWRAHDQKWQTMVFTTLTLSQMAHVLAIRSDRWSLLRIGLLSNKPLAGAVALTVILQLALVYIPFLQRLFQTVALAPADLALATALPVAVWSAVELEKHFSRRHSKN